MNKRPVLIEPTIELLEEQRKFHVTQREFHDGEITYYDSQLRKRKQQLEEIVIAEQKLLAALKK